MAAADELDTNCGSQPRGRLRFSVKRLLWLTVAACVAFGLAFGPRRYTATANASFQSPPAPIAMSEYPARHPRFVQYETDGLSDEEIVRRELPRILDDTVVAEAVKRLAKDGVSEAELGGDASRWFREHLEIRDNADFITIRVSVRQSWHKGRENHRRDTLAWKALVALLSAYQADALGEVTESVAGAVNGDPSPLPFLSFHYVDASWW